MISIYEFFNKKPKEIDHHAELFYHISDNLSPDFYNHVQLHASHDGNNLQYVIKKVDDDGKEIDISKDVNPGVVAFHTKQLIDQNETKHGKPKGLSFYFNNDGEFNTQFHYDKKK